MKHSRILFVFLSISLVVSCSGVSELANYDQTDTTETSVPPSTEAEGSDAVLLSAFFGADNAFPQLADRFVCEGAAGSDGMPVIFSHQVDTATLQAGDFKVTTASGTEGTLTVVTLVPADDPGESRTVLLIGEYGSIDDPPVKVEIVGDLLSQDRQINFRGTSVGVTPLEEGPSMVFAQIVPEEEWDIGKEATRLPLGGGSGCPTGTRQVVRVTWQGGVTKPGGSEIDDEERLLYRVTVRNADGTDTDVTPFAIADLGDGDNNHELCLDVDGDPQSVSFPAGHVTDPREDLNPETSVAVTP